MIPLQLSSCKKLYSRETQRAATLEETLKRAEGKLPVAGITRIADITQLDRVGIPVFSCIRPTAELGAVSVYNGKGATPLAARVSAMMEGIERFSGEVGAREIHYARYEELEQITTTLDPCELILPSATDPSGILPWVEGYDLIRNESIMVPAQAVFHPLSSPYSSLFRTSTNGLASGNTREEAIFHALTEVIERDAWSLVETMRNAGPQIVGVDGDTVSSLIKRFHRAEIDVQLRDITSDLDIPTIAAVADDVLLKDPALLTIGMGTHTSATIAAIRALTEVAQSRLTQIHGAREDIPHSDVRKRIGYERTKRLNRHWFEAEMDVGIDEIQSLDSPDFLDDILLILGHLLQKGINRVIVVDLTRSEIEIPVVRVIVPGLEVYAIDNERKGERCRNARDHRLSRTESGST